MDKYFAIAVLLVFVILGILGLVFFWYFKRSAEKKKSCELELEKTKREQEGVYDTIAGLTSLSGVRSALDYIAENLQKLGFPKILVFVIDKEKRLLQAEIALGFKEDLDLAKIKIPINSQAGLVGQTLIKNKFFVIEDGGNELYNSLEFREDLQLGSFMMAPMAKKSDDKCWETFHCTRTACPAYENEDPRCWAVPKTRCASHLKKNYNDKIFINPDDKMEACLDCEGFQALGVMLVAKREFTAFEEDDKKLFRAFAYQAGSKLERAYLIGHLEEREREITRRMYELSILKELGERIGYSLNTQKIADIITGSLKKLIDYSATSYMLIDPNKKKLLFKCQLEEAVNQIFVDTVKSRMLAGLSALINQELKAHAIDESLAGTILDETVKDPVRSFFNIPLTLGEKVVGMLNVSSTRPGLYKEDEMTILYKITAQASNAVTRLQRVLEAEQGKLNAMVASMADGVLMIDKENRVYVINPKVKKMLNLEKEDISIFDVIGAMGDKIDFRTKFEESVKLDRLVIAEEVYLNDIFLRILFSPVKDRSGEVLGAVIIFHDITHDKEIEKMREDFTSMMVHDLRSPLNGIRLTSELLEKKKDLGSEPMESIKLIHQSSSSMLELVNDLLDVAKMESGKFIANKQPGNLLDIIKDRLGFFQNLAHSKSVNLATQIDKHLPQLRFDKKEIEQVLDNLLSNALKFTEPGGSVIIQALFYKKGEDIESNSYKNGIAWLINNQTEEIKRLNKESVICAVTDSGCGISKEKIPKLFNKFEQVEGEYKSKSKGTGLGLVIVKGIIEAHGGVVGVESNIDKGSTFFFTLPAE